MANEPKDSKSQDSSVQKVDVNANTDGEATNQTSKDGSTATVSNTTSIPQNKVTKTETVNEVNAADKPIAEAADDARTGDETKFADESNPNQKARNSAAPDEYDQDGNPRTGGYSYGVAADDSDGTVEEPSNQGKQPTDASEPFTGRVMNEPGQMTDFLNTDTNNAEWSVEDQQKLEKELSNPSKGIAARVTTSAGDYVRIKFFRNNKPLGTYRSRSYDKSKVKTFLARLQKENPLV